jgi:hypothetical protein
MMMLSLTNPMRNGQCRANARKVTPRSPVLNCSSGTISEIDSPLYPAFRVDFITFLPVGRTHG